jgi:hypothetical protein
MFRRRYIVFICTSLYTFSAEQVYDESEILRQLPGSLNDELITFLYQDMIASVALFHNMKEEVIMQICMQLRHTVILRDMFAIQQGQLGKEMFIIETGEVEALGKNTSNPLLQPCMIYALRSCVVIPVMSKHCQHRPNRPW